MYELIYTSAPRGLLQGRSGFCTVAMTTGFPPNLIPVLENMSGYRCLFPPEHPDAGYNPVNCVYQQLLPVGSPLYALSRIEYAGLSYTGRSNILAHHYILSPQDWAVLNCPPADILRRVENFPAWSGEPRLITEQRLPLPAPPLPGDSAENWKKWTGSGEWAAAAAALFRERPNSFLALGVPLRQCSCQDLLALTGEVCRLLTPAERLRFSFSTYCYQNLIGSSIFLRAYPEDSVQLESIRKLRQAPVVMLGHDTPVPPELHALMTPEAPSRDVPQNMTETMPLSASCRMDETIRLSLERTPVPAQRPFPVRTTRPSLPVCSPEKSGEDPDRSTRFRMLFLAFAVFSVVCVVALLLFLAGKKEEPAPSVVRENTCEPVGGIAEIPAMKTSAAVPEKQDPRPPAATLPSPSKALPASPPPPPHRELTQEEQLDFYLALNAGKTEIALPEPWKDVRHLTVTLCGVKQYQIPGEQLAAFVSGNGSGMVRIHDVQQSEGGFGKPLIPAPDRYLMTLQTEKGYLRITHNTAPGENLRNLAALRFGRLAPFPNRLSRNWLPPAISRYRIQSTLAPDGTLQLRAKYYGREPLNAEILSKLELVLFIDGRVISHNAPESRKLAVVEMQQLLQKIGKLESASEEQKKLKAKLRPPSSRESLETIRVKTLQKQQAELAKLRKAQLLCQQKIKDAEKQLEETKRKKERQKIETEIARHQEELEGLKSRVPKCQKTLKALESKTFFQNITKALPRQDQIFWNQKPQPDSPDESVKLLRLQKNLKMLSPYEPFLAAISGAAKKYEAELAVYAKQKKNWIRSRNKFVECRQELAVQEPAKMVFVPADLSDSAFSGAAPAERLRQKLTDWYRKHISVQLRIKQEAEL